MDLNHLHLHVKDIDKSRKFYEKYFGFSEHTWHGEILFLRNGKGFDLALCPDENEWDFPGWFHFGFRLNSAGEVKKLFAEIKSGSEKIDTELEESDEFVFFRCLDPDMNKLEIYWE
jgi:catechol 2,3-dioxygenase-like lactoylglutathione lyase family enzyme